MNDYKLSICVVALDEEDFLPGLLQDIKSQKYPHELTEVVLVDSGSSDSTKSIMLNFADNNNDFYNIQVLDNPKKNQASGWNVAITHATGDVISRIDAHTMIPDDFSVKVIRNIEAGEDIVGGIRPCIIKNGTKWSKMLLAVENSLFGSSINSSRHSKEKKYVETMFHASYKKEVFEKAGLFNEKLLRTEDNEMHYRMRQAGFKFLYDPEIISYQYARNSLKKMLKQKYANGYWIGLTLGVCPGCLSTYHFVPCVFVLAIVVTTLFSIFGIWQFSALMWACYFLFCTANTLISIKEEAILPEKLLMPLCFLFLHISYGIGTINGLIKMPFKRKEIEE